MTDIEKFFIKLIDDKFSCIVSSNKCSELEIAVARAEDRFIVLTRDSSDETGFGFVLRVSNGSKRD